MSVRSSAEEQPSPKGQATGSNPVGRTIRVNPNFTIELLDEMNRLQVYGHLLRLSREDRYLRFCSAASDEFIHRYVYSMMNPIRDPAYGAFINGQLVGLAHIALVDKDSCEVAFSIDFGYRGTGLARHLMKAAIDHCRHLGVKKMCMSCLRENRKMQALAASFGLDMTITYDEAYAELGVTK